MEPTVPLEATDAAEDAVEADDTTKAWAVDEVDVAEIEVCWPRWLSSSPSVHGALFEELASAVAV